MSDSIAPESRIFRIGRECYVVYLGKERDDVRPFLRIGNIRDIPDEVHNAVSTTVITDDHVGNPLLEILNVPKFDGRYLGDTAVVGTMKRFFKSFDLPTEELTDYRQYKDGEKRHMVWFYSSGNIHLRYDDQVIFDLHRREKEDRHFVRLYEEAKTEFLRNPLRYIRQDFAGPGFVLTGDNAFWFEGGEIISLAAHPGFVARLMSDGIDPDFITASACDFKDDEMDSHDAAVFIGFVKRVRQRRKELRVLTSEPDLQRKIRLLFPGRDETPATLEVADVSGKRKATFKDSIIAQKDGIWRIHRAGLPETVFGGDSDQGLILDIDAGTIRCEDEEVSAVFIVPDGFPVSLVGHDISGAQLIDKYSVYLFNHIGNHFSEAERAAAGALDRYIRLFRDDTVAGKTGVSQLLKQHSHAARDALRRGEISSGGASWFYFSNALAILNHLTADLDREGPPVKNAETVMSVLKTVLDKTSDPDSVLPFWGDLYLGEKPCLLWRAAKRGFTPADITAARDVNGKIRQIATLNKSRWNDDLQRLLRLIRSLGLGGEGPLTEEQLALLARPEEEPQPEKEKPAQTVRKSSAPASVPKREKPAAPRVSPDTTGGKTEPRRYRKRKPVRLWILPVLLILLLIGAVVWDLSGRAPWGRVFRVESVSNGGKSRDEAGADDAKEIGKDDTGANDAQTGVIGTDAVGTKSDVGDDGMTDSLEKDQSGSTPGDEETKGSAGDEENDDTSNGEDTAVSNASFSDVKPGDVDVDRAPRTLEDVEIYLNVDDRVVITEADIHLAANEIAVLNGYKDLDYRVFTGGDPDWIYPGNALSLPDRGEYTIRTGDTIWFLAAREVRVDVENDLTVFDRALKILDDGTAGEREKNGAAEQLREIALNSRAASLRRMASDALERRQF